VVGDLTPLLLEFHTGEYRRRLRAAAGKPGTLVPESGDFRATVMGVMLVSV
jgi:hypothetical protein